MKKIPLVIFLITIIFITYFYLKPSIKFIYPIRYETDAVQHLDNEKRFAEWWYFDGFITENLSFILTFFVDSKGQYIELSLYDSKSDYRKTYHFDFSTSETRISRKKCQIIFGKNSIREENGNYIVNIDNGSVLLNFRLVPVIKGCAFLSRSRGAAFYPSIKAVPRGRITGSIKYENQKINFDGLGYQDHNYFRESGTLNALRNGWYWGRFFTEHYTVNITQFFNRKLPSYIMVFKNDKLIKFLIRPHLTLMREEINNKIQLPAEVTFKVDEFILSISNDNISRETNSYVRFVNKVKLKVSGPGGKIAEDGEGLSEFVYKKSK